MGIKTSDDKRFIINEQRNSDCKKVYRGRNLKEFNLETTKPTTDRVKENLFNLIQFQVADAVVLDLFSGTGALGIESISRGAKQVFLIEKNKDAIKIIKSNLDGIEGDYILKEMDAFTFLNETKIKFDIILLDPPYKTDFGVKAIELILKNDLLNESGVILFETSSELNFELNFNGLNVSKKKYGSVTVYKMEKV